MSFDYAAMEVGVAELIRAKLGFAEGAILWAGQNLSEPDPSIRTWVSLRRQDLQVLGEVDAVYTLETPGTPPPGSEVTLTAAGLRSFILSIQAFARGDTNRRGGTVGNASAYAVLSRLTAALRLRGSEDSLVGLGLGLMRLGPVRSLDALVDERIQGRALVEAQFNLVESASETTTYIQRVSGSLTLDASPSPIPFASAP